MTLSASTGCVHYPAARDRGQPRVRGLDRCTERYIRVVTSTDDGAHLEQEDGWHDHRDRRQTAGRVQRGPSPHSGRAARMLSLIMLYMEPAGPTGGEDVGSQGNRLKRFFTRDRADRLEPAPRYPLHGGAAGATDGRQVPIVSPSPTLPDFGAVDARVGRQHAQPGKGRDELAAGAGGQTYADGFGPAAPPHGRHRADGGVRRLPAPAGRRAPAPVLPPARLDVLVMALSGHARRVVERPHTHLRRARSRHRTNAEPSLVQGGPRFRVSLNRYQSSFSDYLEIWPRSVLPLASSAAAYGANPCRTSLVTLPPPRAHELEF